MNKEHAKPDIDIVPATALPTRARHPKASPWISVAAALILFVVLTPLGYLAADFEGAAIGFGCALAISLVLLANQRRVAPLEPL